jgi:hypothetical protein
MEVALYVAKEAKWMLLIMYLSLLFQPYKSSNSNNNTTLHQQLQQQQRPNDTDRGDDDDPAVTKTTTTEKYVLLSHHQQHSHRPCTGLAKTTTTTAVAGISSICTGVSINRIEIVATTIMALIGVVLGLVGAFLAIEFRAPK